MLRGLILAVANRPAVRRLVTGGAGRKVALRFVAGEDLDDGLAVVKSLNAEGFAVSLDYLGENVADAAEARAATDVYRSAIERIAAAGLDANVSVKLTQQGLDLDPDLAHQNASTLVSAAAQADTTLTLDMEDHRYTARTIDACLELDREHPGRAGIAIQTYLYRSPDDLERLLHVPVRLCKGAYREPKNIAYPRKADVDRQFARMLARLIEAGRYPMIATHDERLVRFAISLAERAGRSRDTYEFQMLYGVRRELQRTLLGDGYRVRVYVPFGSQWYPYLVRRLAERPANLMFFMQQLGRK